ncbi:hypothetical protein C8Q80DRAFT_1156652 [Daedaleopsis nitida]|nr:hypothetical protein C8Q80DRAFT_1156652 [Daedaleopsis nitida]
MATVIDVSSRLGEYMLKGWVLTDRICTKCAKVPLMRSPPSASTEVHFCVNCDPAPSTGNAATTAPPLSSRAAPRPSAPQDGYSISSTSNSSVLSRSSTPPTEVSNAPSSPPFAPIMDTAELLRRRRQSDAASAEIGKRMLKGWAMLADECPSPDCYGIPLVRPPKAGTTVDPKKECVICGVVYVDEKNSFGQDSLVPIHPASSPAATYRAPTSPSLPAFIKKGKGRASEIAPLPTSAIHQTKQPRAAAPSASSTSSALETTVQSLEQTLVALSERLNSYASSPIIDPAPIGQTADAISKVTQALTQIKQLLWNENEALLR